jgi:hypothetical protein
LYFLASRGFNLALAEDFAGEPHESHLGYYQYSFFFSTSYRIAHPFGPDLCGTSINYFRFLSHASLLWFYMHAISQKHSNPSSMVLHAKLHVIDRDYVLADRPHPHSTKNNFPFLLFLALWVLPLHMSAGEWQGYVKHDYNFEVLGQVDLVST